MKLIAALCACSFLAGGQTAPAVDAKAELRPFIDNLLDAWSSLDPARVAPLFAKDPGLLHFDVSPFLYKGWDGYESGFRKAAAQMESIRVKVGDEFQATRRGDVAWVVYTINFTGRLKSGETMDGPGRVTDILEKRHGKWLVVHEHVSMAMPEIPTPEAKR